METRILSFAIEGINRAGKGTQLELLANYLTTYFNIPTFILRGEGRRYKEEGEIHYKIERYGKTGKGIYSMIWNKINPLTKQKESKEEFYKAWDIAAKQLDKEAYYFIEQQLPEILENEGKKTGIILFDRSIISKYTRQIETRGSKPFSQTYEQTLVKPNHYFVLNVSEEELLRRASTDKSSKAEFRKQIIRKNSKIFPNAVVEAQKVLGNQISIINGEQSKRKVHKNIRKKVDEYIRQTLI